MTDPRQPDAPRITQTKTLVKAKRFNYEELSIQHPSGHVETRHLIRHPGACIILPILNDGRIAMIRVWRAAFGRPLLEFPAGTLEPGEPPHRTAERELVEEAGLAAETMVKLAAFYTSPGLSDEIMHAFVATGLTEVGQRLEPYEQIIVVRHTPAEIEEAIVRGELLDGKSLVTWFMAVRLGFVRI